jgi:hypothetical protein
MNTIKQTITINRIRTTTSRATTLDKARQWLDNLERQWDDTLGKTGLNTAKSVTRNHADCLTIVNSENQTIVIENKVGRLVRS